MRTISKVASWLASGAMLIGSVGAPVVAAPARPTVAGPAQPATANKACALTSFTAPAGTTLVSAQGFSDPVPYCRVNGYVTTTNPGPNKVNFMLAVPRNWNGRYLFTVQGGAAGFIPDPTAPHLQEGYAIASTDKGVVTSHILDFSFRANPAMDLDWAHRGTHVAAVATQALARSYYDRDKLYRYVMGCSGGGDGTLTEAEMYPTDFDAHIAGAMNTDWPYGTTLNWAVIAQRVNKVPGSWISQQEYDRIHDTLLAKYDARDSAVDNLIWDPRIIKLDASDRKALSFLSEPQFGTLKLIASAIRNAKGDELAPAFWLGNVKMFPIFLTGRTAPPWPNQSAFPAGFVVADTSAKAQEGPTFSLINDVDFTKVVDKVPGIEGTKFDHKRLAGLARAGHKLILWTGTAEEAVAPGQIVGYTERLQKTYGAAAPSFQRTFLVPGLHHCSRGDNAPTDTVDKMLKAAQTWVEEGQAPSAVILSNSQPEQSGRDAGGIPASMMKGLDRSIIEAQSAVTAARTYKLCAYPQRSVFKGGANNPRKLNVNDAANWECKR